MMIKYYRIANALIFLYLCLSQILMPVVAPNDQFWQAKTGQLLQFGPFDDLPRLIGRGIPLLLIWLFIDWRIRRRSTRPASRAS
jgi:hypothetical protein